MGWCAAGPIGCGVGVAVTVGIMMSTPAGQNAMRSIGRKIEKICKSDDDCEEEWNWAYRHCKDLMSSGNSNWREVGRRPVTVESCAMGYVSERCGGNRAS
jgi:hypothetical protein